MNPETRRGVDEAIKEAAAELMADSIVIEEVSSLPLALVQTDVTPT